MGFRAPLFSLRFKKKSNDKVKALWALSGRWKLVTKPTNHLQRLGELITGH